MTHRHPDPVKEVGLKSLPAGEAAAWGDIAIRALPRRNERQTACSSVANRVDFLASAPRQGRLESCLSCREDECAGPTFPARNPQQWSQQR